MFVRIKQAIEDHPELVDLARDALADKGFAAFVRANRCDSDNEAEFWIRLQARGGRFARTSMARLSWRGAKPYRRGTSYCICGRLCPVMYVVHPVPMIFFSQISFHTSSGPRRVDALVAVAGQGWFALEINGERHDARRDHLRALELGIPVVTLVPKELGSERLLEMLLERFEFAREVMTASHDLDPSGLG